MQGTTLETIIADPEHARLLCEVMSDSVHLPKRKSYQVMRALKPDELFHLYRQFCFNREGFHILFGSMYHDKRGDSLGPLFEGEWYE